RKGREQGRILESRLGVQATGRVDQPNEGVGRGCGQIGERFVVEVLLRQCALGEVVPGKVGSLGAGVSSIDDHGASQLLLDSEVPLLRVRIGIVFPVQAVAATKQKLLEASV